MKSNGFRKYGMNFAILGAAGLFCLSGCGGGAGETEPDEAQPGAARSVMTPPVSQDGNAAQAALSEARDPDDVVATVDGHEILQKEVDREVENMLSRFGGSLPPDQLAGMRRQIASRALEQLVTARLLENATEEAGIEVSEEEVETARAEFLEQLPEGRSLDELLAMHGISAEKFEEEMKKSLRIQKLFEQETAGLTEPTDEEVAEFYEENKAQMETPEQVSARHILIKTSEEADEEERAAGKKKAEDLRQKLEEGADFAEMAAEYSEDPGSAETGGEYTFSRGQMTPAFEEAAFEQEIGVIGPVVETPFGFHIIEVLKRTPAETQSLEDVSEDIKSHLKSQSQGKAIQQFIEKLREKADISYM